MNWHHLSTLLVLATLALFAACSDEASRANVGEVRRQDERAEASFEGQDVDLPYKVLRIRNRGFDAYFPTTDEPIDFDRLTDQVSEEFRAMYESGEYDPTAATWYDEWPPRIHSSLIIHGFAWNALKVEDLLRPGEFRWLPLKLQTLESISEEPEKRPSRDGLPSGSSRLRSHDLRLYEDGEIVSYTLDGKFNVRVRADYVVPFKVVFCNWYTAENEHGRSELRFVFGAGWELWPLRRPGPGEQEGYAPERKLQPDLHVEVGEMMRYPWGLEPVGAKPDLTQYEGIRYPRIPPYELEPLPRLAVR